MGYGLKFEFKYNVLYKIFKTGVLIMLENIVQLKIVREDRPHLYILPNNTSLGEAFDVLSEMRNIIIEKIKEHETQNERQNEKEAESGNHEAS